MKHCNKEKEPQVPEGNNQFLQRLRDEKDAFIKLIKQLEDHDPTKPKPAENNNPVD